MDGFSVAANGIVSLVTAAALTAVILSRNIEEGLITKVGLIIVTLSMYASGAVSLLSDDPVRGLVNSAFALRIGLLIACVGVAKRMWPRRAEGL